MNREIPQPGLPDKRKPAGKPNDDWSQWRPSQPREGAPANNAPRRMAHPFGFHRKVDGPGIDQPEHRPRGDDDDPGFYWKLSTSHLPANLSVSLECGGLAPLCSRS